MDELRDPHHREHVELHPNVAAFLDEQRQMDQSFTEEDLLYALGDAVFVFRGDVTPLLRQLETAGLIRDVGAEWFVTSARVSAER